jgi:hypothetical protein
MHCRKKGFSLDEDVLLGSGIGGLKMSENLPKQGMGAHLWRFITHDAKNDVKNDTDREMRRVIVHTVC